MLIICIFLQTQELSMKFELFQQHPAVEYEPHLDRVTRQLRDIREKVRVSVLLTFRAIDKHKGKGRDTMAQNFLSDARFFMGLKIDGS
jgi:hypothetical protein